MSEGFLPEFDHTSKAPNNLPLEVKAQQSSLDTASNMQQPEIKTPDPRVQIAKGSRRNPIDRPPRESGARNALSIVRGKIRALRKGEDSSASTHLELQERHEGYMDYTANAESEDIFAFQQKNADNGKYYVRLTRGNEVPVGITGNTTTATVRFGTTYRDIEAEYNALANLHSIDPIHVAKPEMLLTTQQGVIGYAMENIEGGMTVYQWMLRNNIDQLPDGMYQQMASVIGNAHEHGLIHGDLNLDNMLMTKDGIIKIIDPVAIDGIRTPMTEETFEKFKQYDIDALQRIKEYAHTTRIE